MQRPYFLPPQDLLFKLLDKDIKLIVGNYGVTKQEAWKGIYQTSVNKDHSPRARDTALNSEIEKPRCVPDLSRPMLNQTLKLSRNHSLGPKRRQSSIGRKLDVSAYKQY